MKSRDFCYWLQGFFEISEDNIANGLNGSQVRLIRNHLNMVFIHEIDPSFPQTQQTSLSAAHGHLPAPSSGVTLKC